MKNSRSTFVSLVAVGVFCQAAYGGDESDRNSLRFDSGLSGAQEVGAAVITNTTGAFRLDFDRGLSEADFRLRVKDGTAITQAHIHCGRAGTNGPVVAFLFGFVPGGVNVDGLLATGTLTQADFVGADCTGVIGIPVNNIASLAFAAREGLIYVNVHSVANPPGEVRGQLLER